MLLLAYCSSRKAFRGNSLVFLRGVDQQPGRWLALKDCIWAPSVLQSKHALMPSLNRDCGLFSDTLGVSNMTTDMLVSELLRESTQLNIKHHEDRYLYIKELVQKIARIQKDDTDLQKLRGKKCWPCRTPTRAQALRSIDDFFVNDRQNLFNLFADTHAFLDFDFDKSRNVYNLLRSQDCKFLSENVGTETSPGKPLECDPELMQDLRSRANALVRYVHLSSERHRSIIHSRDLDISSMPSPIHSTSCARFLES
jgi:hypothetical protein